MNFDKKRILKNLNFRSISMFLFLILMFIFTFNLNSCADNNSNLIEDYLKNNNPLEQMYGDKNEMFFYVKPYSTGNKNGSSWKDATTLQKAIDKANYVIIKNYTKKATVFISKGIHKPIQKDFFELKSGINLYGGFVKENKNLNEREFGTTILAPKSDNEQALIMAHGVEERKNNTILDGVVITNSKATGLKISGDFNLKIINTTFVDNKGGEIKGRGANNLGTGYKGVDGEAGAISVLDNVNLEIVNSTFSKNIGSSGTKGGTGIIKRIETIDGKKIEKTAYGIGGNGGDGGAGAISISGISRVKIVNCTFAENTSGLGGEKGEGNENSNSKNGENGGAVFVKSYGIKLEIYNSIFDKNIILNNTDIYNFGITENTENNLFYLNVMNSVFNFKSISKYISLSKALDNKNSHASLAAYNAKYQIYPLLDSSVAINGGDDKYFKDTLVQEKDQIGNPRIIGSKIDAGSIEFIESN